MSVTFSALDYIGLRARREIESHREQAEEARYRRVLLELKTQQDRALAQLEGARQVAAQIPVQLAAARDAERQAGARYKAGLGTLVEVAEAQRLLTQIEIDEALSKLAVWRAWLGVAATAGDLAPLLEKAGQ
jgi:outer membrane protein TolC